MVRLAGRDFSCETESIFGLEGSAVFHPLKTIVIGLGNPILGDDGVGWRVAEDLQHQLSAYPQIDVKCLSLGGISLMENLAGYEHAILIDACISNEEPGSITVSRLDDLPDLSAFHTTSVHDMSLQNAMKLGRNLGAQLPEDVMVVGISARQVYDFSEELSQPVAESVPKAAKVVMKLAMQNITIQ